MSEPSDTPDPRATLELVTDRTNYIEQCVTTGGLSPSGCQTTVAILRDAIRDLRRLAEVEAENARLKTLMDKIFDQHPEARTLYSCA